MKKFFGIILLKKAKNKHRLCNLNVVNISVKEQSLSSVCISVQLFLIVWGKIIKVGDFRYCFEATIKIKKVWLRIYVLLTYILGKFNLT